MKTVIFRADGNSQIGLGHVMRCLAMAEMIIDNFTIKFAIQNPSENVIKLLSVNRISVISLPETIDYQKDLVNFLTVVSKDDIVVLDGYYFTENYQKILKNYCKSLVYIDDLHAWHQYADIIINHSGSARKSDYSSEPYTEFLLGTQYALLRKEFFQTQLPDCIPDKLTNILINLGGADPENLSHRIVEILLKSKPALKLVLILGGANKHVAAFSHFQTETLQIKQNLSADEMIAEILACDLAIVSCSTVSYEVAIINKPFLGILTADNQMSLRDFYHKNNIALSVLEKNFEEDALLKVLEKSKEEISLTLKNQQTFFDKKTKDRISACFNNL